MIPVWCRRGQGSVRAIEKYPSKKFSASLIFFLRLASALGVFGVVIADVYTIFALFDHH
jgi:F0F1-type ATP synthase membrane subunit c/vacuolar-type H+-ATPase subunit K